MSDDTRRNDLAEIKFTNDAHAGLWLDKFIQNQSSDANLNGLRNRGKKITAKGLLVEELSSITVPKIYDTFYQRWVTGLDSLKAKKGKAAVQGRMAIGLGDENVLETSVKLHRTYGVPYIPGSALKGLAASYARNRIGGEWAAGKQAYQIVFGKMEEAGYVTFHDALYVPGTANGQPLQADVITVHHQDYYGIRIEKDGQLLAPGDWVDPNPVPFLSATGDYLVALSAMPDCSEWVAQTWKILELALREEGIGAKTSSGYGRMKLVECKA